MPVESGVFLSWESIRGRKKTYKIAGELGGGSRTRTTIDEGAAVSVCIEIKKASRKLERKSPGGGGSGGTGRKIRGR